jgi:hypothetical protein
LEVKTERMMNRSRQRRQREVVEVKI